MRHLVVGTAGHIDHGKSALVRALTGIDPDRLKEEKLRGITIDLGFADLDRGGGRVLSFVDVPGHERFVRHMVAGATGIDAVLLAIAADDGIRPQTREHVAICTLLHVRRGVVAVTKADLVDADVLGVVALEAREFLAGTFLEAAPLVPVSSRTGQGLDALRTALDALFDLVPERPATGMLRLPVDRSFVMRGFGTVVTGTLASGTVREGAEIEVLPGRKRGRVRGVQVHHQRVDAARAGQRTAVNLQGLGCDEVPRGTTITSPGALLTTRRILARVELLPDAVDGLRAGGPVRFHQGTSERSARLRVLGDRGGGTFDVEILLGRESVLLPGDRFILRRPAPVDTVGGGAVLDIRPPAPRIVREGSADLTEGGPDERVRVRLARSGAAGRLRTDLVAELGLAPGDLSAIVERLAAEGRLVAAAASIFDANAWRETRKRVAEAVGAFHVSEPLRVGMSREELRSQVAREMPQDAWRTLLGELESDGTVRLDGDRVALASHRVVLSGGDLDLANRIEARYREAWLDPPDPDDVVRDGGGEPARRILDLLQSDGRLVRIKDGRLFHGDALDDLRRKLREYGRRSRMIDVSAFKELAGVTRKNAIPLLEQLDAERVTRRIGNAREILND